MGCPRVTAKYSMFLFNLLLLLCGIGLIVLGILNLVNYSVFKDIHPAFKYLAAAPILTIVVGGLTIIVAFFGCCGACFEIPSFLTVYIVLVVILFFLQVIITIVIFICLGMPEFMEKNLDKGLRKVFDNYKSGSTSTPTKLVDFMQQQYECCGVDGPGYWKDHGDGKPPDSCNNEETKQAFTEGCTKQVNSNLNQSVRIIGIAVLILSAIEMLFFWLAIFLRKLYIDEVEYNYRWSRRLFVASCDCKI